MAHVTVGTAARDANKIVQVWCVSGSAKSTSLRQFELARAALFHLRWPSPQCSSQICLSWHRNSQQESAWFPGASLSGIDRHSQLLSTCVFHLCKLGNDRRRFALMSQLHPLSRKNNLWIGLRNPSIQLNVKSLFCHLSLLLLLLRLLFSLCCIVLSFLDCTYFPFQ